MDTLNTNPQLATITEDITNLPKVGNIIVPLANSLIEQGLRAAITEVLRIDLDKTSEQNIQRVMDTMRYDKFEAYKKSNLVKCSDGYIFYESRDSSLIDDTGMCYELAAKTAAWLQIMYPDSKFHVAQDTERPNGWNHFFVLRRIAGQEDYIIDPSKNRQGNITETGKWDKSGIDYKLDEVRDLHDNRNIKYTTIQEVKKKKMAVEDF